MNTSNNFNICSRCGTANSLTAKYCYQCGAQLKLPQEPVVCPKCHTVNTSAANFCRTCGNNLKSTSIQQKECPRCHKMVDANSNVCSCGYMFATVGEGKPKLFGRNAKSKGEQATIVPVSAEQGASDAKRIRKSAFWSLVWVLLFAYLFFAPAEWRFGIAFLSFPTVMWTADSSMLFTNVIGGIIRKSISIVGCQPYQYLILGLIAFCALTLVIQGFAAIVKLGGKGKPKKFSVWYLLLFLITAAVATAMRCGESWGFLKFLFGETTPFNMGDDFIFAVPAFYLIMTLKSIPSKVKHEEE